MKSAAQPLARRTEQNPAPDARPERLDRVASRIVEHARSDAEPYLRESEVPAGGE
jgi:hypothetical protein